ncbi:MAG TPA: gephyrin-like molybdotransferase Glp [Acidimicrobiia bacterium]|nr:gephyrin-like molybdotransferase Glp [Acidimicrobiia bacterium]
MRPLNEAQAEVLSSVPLLSEVEVPLTESLGLALSRPVTAPHPVPPFANSAMDGYAVRAGDLQQAPVRLRVLEDVPAGRVPTRSVDPGTAIKIMTGAPIPAGADAVVRVEDTEPENGLVNIVVSVPAGTSVRPAGGDVEAGDQVLSAGVRLGPAQIGVLANLGVAHPQVHRRPRVAIASTGDELVEVDGPPLGPGQIRDSNRPMLIAALRELGVDVVDLGHIPDDAEALRRGLARGASEADVIVTSGGVSMGEYDLVKAVLGELGEVGFWQVAMQPAKPFAFGRVEGVPFFGLPGNPVSSFVAFEQFLRPALLQMMGSTRLFRPRVPGRTRSRLETDPAKTVFLRVRTVLEGNERWAEPSGHQASNVLSAVASGDAFAVVAAGIGVIEAGGEVTLEMFRWPESRGIDEL